jgi:hypothetical protein
LRVTAAREHAEQALDHLLEVGLAFAQVLVFHLVELARQHLELSRERPFGVVVALPDPMLGRAGQRLVVEQHQVHVEQGRELGRRFRRQVHLHRRQAGGDRVARHPIVAHVVVGDVDPARGNEHGPPDRDPSGNRQAEELEGHCDRS